MAAPTSPGALGFFPANKTATVPLGSINVKLDGAVIQER